MTSYYERGDIRIYHGDARDIAPQLPPVDLVVTSPPYAEQRQYGMKKGAFRWDRVVPRVLAGLNLAPDGQMLVNLGLVHLDGEVTCYWDPMIQTLRSFGYRLFGWYVWDQGSSLPGDWSGRLGPSHEWVFHFNAAPKRPVKCVPTKGGRVVHGSGIRRTKDGNTAVRVMSDDGLKYQPFKIPDSVIRLARDTSAGNGHPARFPVRFADFMLRAWSGTVLDPFMGGGTTLLAAYRLNRPAVGIDIEESYCEIAAKRLEAEVLPLESIA